MMKTKGKPESKNIIDVRSLTARINSLEEAMEAAQSLGDSNTYNASMMERNKLLDYLNKTTGYSGRAPASGPSTKEEIVGKWQDFLNGPQGNPEDPHDIPVPSRRPDPQISSRTLAPSYAGGGIVNMLPDSMMNSPLLYQPSVDNERGIRSLMRATETSPMPEQPILNFAEGGLAPDSGRSIFQRFWDWRTEGLENTPMFPGGGSALDASREGIARRMGPEWSDMPVPPVTPGPADAGPVIEDRQSRIAPPRETYDDYNRRIEEEKRIAEEDAAAEIERQREEYRIQREEDIRREIELRKSLMPQAPQMEYPMPDKAQEAERMKHLANMQIFSGMMQSAGGDFAGIGAGFSRAGDKYEQGYQRYQDALLGKAAVDNRNKQAAYEQEAGIAGGAIKGRAETESAIAERRYSEEQEDKKYQRDIAKEGMKQRQEIMKTVIEGLRNSTNPEDQAKASQLEDKMLKDYGIVLPRVVPRQ